MNADKLCALMGLTPSTKWSFGDRRRTPSGELLEGFRQETYCSFELDNSNYGEISDILDHHNKKLTSKKVLFSEIKATGGEIEYFIGIEIKDSFGDTLESGTLATMSKLGISLALDIYSTK